MKGATWPPPWDRDDENLLKMTRAMRVCITKWPHRRAFYVSQYDQFAAECERRGLTPP